MMNQKNPLSQKVKIKIKGEVPVLSIAKTLVIMGNKEQVC